MHALTLALITFHFTVSGLQARSPADCRPDSLNGPEALATATLTVLDTQNGHWQFTRPAHVGDNSITIPLEPSFAMAYVTLADSSGNVSCPSNTYYFPQQTSVPPAPAPGRRDVWYMDVAGRHLTLPAERLPSGIYWEITRSRPPTRRLIVIVR